MAAVLSGLVAYPSSPTAIGQTLNRAFSELNKKEKFASVRTWEESDIPGRFIDENILEKIKAGNILIADITVPNFNVTFEVGYAIGAKRRAYLIKNKTFKEDKEFFRQAGIYETIGYKEYSNSNDLISEIMEIDDLAPLSFDETKINTRAPVYIVLPRNKGDCETQLIARVKKASLFFRSFDPEEHGRISLPETLENVATSHGIIIHLLSSIHGEVAAHNLRAAFVAGLAFGMSKLILLLQEGEEPVPIDYRNIVKSYNTSAQHDNFIHDFAINIFEQMQSTSSPVPEGVRTLLSDVRLGESIAENEYRDLGNYYIATEDYRRALRGEVQVVLGRKGSGKTAMFFQIRDAVRENRNNVVLDLKPEGFQLVKFKDRVLEYLEAGTREHTITAFWEYLLLLEVCHKIIQMDRYQYSRDPRLSESYLYLVDKYEQDEFISVGDFAERMLSLTNRIANDFKAKPRDEKIMLTSEEITQLLYKHDTKALRDAVTNYLRNKSCLWVLFDNLDKGWPAQGVKEEDVLMIRCLLDAMRKLELSFRKKNIDTNCIIFIRNDVWDQLIEYTPDRGKISTALLDWSDGELFRELLRKRFVYYIEKEYSFEDLWRQISVSHIKGEETSQYLIDRSLMRPRALIELFRECRGHAANSGHTRLEEDDILKGEEKFSTRLIDNVGFEIQDVFSPAKDILYAFLECKAELSKQELNKILDETGKDSETKDRIIELLLWYGVLGFRRIGGESKFIYSVGYDNKKLLALIKKREDEILYVVNCAFWKGLEVVDLPN